MPPSFAPATRPSKPTAAPHAVPHGEFSDAATDDSVDDIADDDIADTPLFGGFTTKIVSLVVVVIVVIAALFFALQGLAGRNSNGTSQNGSNPWPSANLNDVPFGPSQRASGNDKASSTSASATTSPSQSASESITKQPIKAPSIITADKNAAQVPEPQVPLNTTPYNIQRRQFLVNPGGQRGFGYYIQLSQPEKAYRFVIKIRSSGGHAYLFANSTNDPAQGEQVADFAFDPSLTTDVKFTKPVTSQDFLLWVPMNSLPNHKLYVDMVQIY
jgi:putative peptidoglycan lipid II flippase